jgi:hypothetical protein
MTPAMAKRVTRQIAMAALVCCLVQADAWGQRADQTPSTFTVAPVGLEAGSYNGKFLQGGIGLVKPLPAHAAIVEAKRGWTLSLWFKTQESSPTALLAGVGRPDEISPRYLALQQGRPVFWAGGVGEGHLLQGQTTLSPDEWHSLAVAVDDEGLTHLFADGNEVASGHILLGPSSSVLTLAPASASPLEKSRHFGGLLAEVSLYGHFRQELVSREAFQVESGLDNLPFEEGSKPWPFQTRATLGMTAPQDPSTLPHSASPLQTPKAVSPLAGNDDLTANGLALTLRHGWKLTEAADVSATGEQIATLDFSDQTWLAATVPGTVLTTLIDRGVYPDPDFGLNNMAIPESLSRKSFWYRDVFTAPATMSEHRLQLTFHGINYRATVWVNGARIGQVVGAFRSEAFDVTPFIKPGKRTALAVLIDPPPHPGIAHEQSIAAGAGGNGGVMMLDGPTFSATEGWDWLPGVRDRNIGLWQDVTLTATGTVRIDVPQIITRLPLPDRSRAELTVHVPLENSTSASVTGILSLTFDSVHLSKSVTVPPGGMTLNLSPKDDAQLIVQQPRLWWPNGYGEAALHTMTLTFTANGEVSDQRKDRFGMREITYEISALDHAGHLRRVEVSPTEAELAGTQAPVDQTHDSFRETPKGWVPTLIPDAEHSPALKTLTDLRSAPFLVIRVNGVRIAIRGGSWGMDDMRKRVSRGRLEPYFRLHKEANVNMIRNWMGQDTEDTFYDLADEYGLLVWNDFWMSTQDDNLEPTDASLFLANAKDVVTRYRNHPSIAVWCGRNEGVPPPTINEGLARIIAEEDGTRYYSADSNKINLHDSGPYKYQEPEEYFTTLSLGFAVEVGVPSPPTLESFQSFLPKADQWPISDAWAYHDWHQDGNGDVAPFMQAMVDEFGPPSSLADFDRKAQMLNYVDHRAIFEGMNAHLWAPNSGRLLWMTHPSWPSSVWQIYGHDYDTQASFYAVKKASETVHVQMNLPNYDVIVVNNTEQQLTGVKVTAKLFDLSGNPLAEKETTLSATPVAETPAFTLALPEAMKKAGVVLVKLELHDAAGSLLSDNFYWQAPSKWDYKPMNDMALPTLTKVAHYSAGAGDESHTSVTLTNTGKTPAIAAKLTIVDAATGDRILPAYYSDNYISLLPGESKTVSIATLKSAVHGAVSVGLRGWNIPSASIPITP